jgi:hypothetical protein
LEFTQYVRRLGGMSPKKINDIFAVVSVIWVGGWGFLMFRYPETFAKINARFGANIFATPKFMKFIRWMGITGMVLAALYAISSAVMFTFGWNQY